MDRYQLTDIGVIDLETGATIPNDVRNRDWVAFQEWMAEDPENNVPRPACPSGFHYWDAGVWREDLDKKQAHLDASEMRLLELGAGELFFRLCKVLIVNNLIDPEDPKMAEIKDAYQQYKVLKGI